MESVFHIQPGTMNFFETLSDDLCRFEVHVRGEGIHPVRQPLFERMIPALDEIHRLLDIAQIAVTVHVVVAGTGTGVHLEVEAIRMWIVATDVIEEGPKFESPLEGCFQTCELTATDKRAEVVHPRLDLPAGVDTRESLLP